MGFLGFGARVTPLVITPGVVMGSLHHLYSSINERIPFSPAFAAWLFVAGVLNLCWPRLIRHFRWRRMKRNLSPFLKLLIPWLAIHLIWVPFNQILCTAIGKITMFEACSRISWLPYLSTLAALVFFVWSTHRSGALDRVVQPVSALRTKYSGVTDLVIAKKEEPNSDPITMVTRSGRMLGGQLGTDVRLTRRGTVYNSY